MRPVRSIFRLPSLVLTVAVLAAACGGGAATRVIGAPQAGDPTGAVTPGQPIEVAQVDAAPPPVPRGVLAGRVMALASNTPIVRARVVLPAPEEVLPFNRVALTDADGRFRFTDLPAANSFLLTASKTGFAPRAFGEAPPAVPPTLVALAQDEVKDAIVIPLIAQVSIAGRVLDEDGTPFAGALVEAMRAVFENDRRTLVTVADAMTDDRGEFRLVGLPPGQYYLSAFDPAFAGVGDAQGQLFYSPTFYPGVVFPDEATRITLDPGVASERVEFGLKIIRPARVAGSITAPAEAGGVAKQLMAAAVILSPLRNDQFSLFTLTEPSMRPNGEFLFSNVAPGRYKIQARGETEPEGVTQFQVFTLEVQGADQSGVDMVLSPGAIVSRHVEWETETGRVPIGREGLIVRAPMEDGSTFGDAVTGYVGTNDQWLIKGVMAGRHYFRVNGLPPGWYLKRVDFQGGDITGHAWMFDYNEVKPGFKIVLSDRTTIVRGFVTLQGRGDVQGYAVVAFPVSSVHWRPHSRHIRLVYPDSLGRYEIRGLPPGQYLMAATRDVDQNDLGNPRVFDLLSTQQGVMPFGLRENQSLRLDVQPVIRRRVGDR